MTELLLSLAFFAGGAAAAWLIHKCKLRTKQSPAVTLQIVTGTIDGKLPERRYLDPEGPTGRTTTPWVDSPEAASFRVTFLSPLNGVQTLDVAPTPWGSHRRTFAGIAWPTKIPVRFDFADLIQAIDLSTGEMLTPVNFWSAVLTHREDDPPNYVVFAQCIPVLGALAQFSYRTRSRFGQRERDLVTQALAELGYTSPPREAWDQLLSYHTSRPTNPELSLVERRACLVTARRIAVGSGRKPADPDSLNLAESLFQPITKAIDPQEPAK